MTQTTAPTFPPGRYGRRREPRRRRRYRLGLLALVPVLVGALALAWVLYQRYGYPAVQTTVESYTGITDTGVTIHFIVSKPGGQPATCRIKARDSSGAEIGYAQVPVPAGARVPVVFTLPTRGRAIAVDVLGCVTTP